MLESEGKALDRQTMIGFIWPDTTVGDTSRGCNISVLRRHLGADATLSVPEFGYRFTLAVVRAEAADEQENEHENIDTGSGQLDSTALEAVVLQARPIPVPSNRWRRLPYVALAAAILPGVPSVTGLRRSAIRQKRMDGEAAGRSIS